MNETPISSHAAPLHVLIKSWGCQMNVYDSGRMGDVLAEMGYRATEEADQADLVILNTCHIREKASEKLFSELGRLHETQQQRAARGQRMVLAVAGCVAQAQGAEILARAPYVNMVFGPQTYHRLPAMLARVEAGERSVLDNDFPPESKFDSLPHEGAPPGPAAFLSIQEGCDRFCTFCVVPYTRGAESSRPALAVLDEARRLIARGASEITLLGQHVNAWRGAAPDGGCWGLGRLLRAMAELPGLQRLRYTSPHPLAVDDELIKAHGDLGVLMPFLHLPVQSGSDSILKAMNRNHAAADYLRIVERLRAARSDLVLSSDFIVGFPGESEADFQATLDLVREVGYGQAYSFKYSSRPGTPAADMPGQLPEQVKEERLARLQELLWAQQKDFNLRCMGQMMPVLFDRPGRQAGQVLGRSPWMQSVHVEGTNDLIGQIRPVRITQAGLVSIGGDLESHDMKAEALC
ncbi:MAG: tRNA (N6-isopentenyl adenosine(37)-C2)-methylthiotransferase MiaB [Alphaproteobacteria bacterium]|nr:MAG: tRNA (N6-isopentenyl adenosine(37)-C2)-methylthiotransferase MiaB [Alphaproteobacteria bacterium]